LWKKKNLIVMPSCNLLTEGSDILTSKPLSPFLKNTDDFEVYIADKSHYYFGPVRKLKDIT
ncbi:phosphoesterase, partial [Candidatus Woesearchaeota archaeon]|nr:phosphoesterase [Candidatus Woesearchaeota archaeon]